MSLPFTSFLTPRGVSSSENSKMDNNRSKSITTSSPFLTLPYLSRYGGASSNISEHDEDRSRSPSKTSIIGRSVSFAIAVTAPTTEKFNTELLSQTLPFSSKRSLSNPLFPRKTQAAAVGSQRIPRSLGQSTSTPFSARALSDSRNENTSHIRTSLAAPAASYTAVLNSSVSGPVLVLPTVC
jgi:hypothetical protein